MKENYKSVLILVILCLFLITCLFHVNPVINEILRYTTLFFKRVFPSSFLFLMISSLLIDYQFVFFIQKLFKMNSTYLYVFIFSLISGFPSGAFITRELFLKKEIDDDMANKIMMYSHFPNPLFVISSISVILGNIYESIYLLLSIIISNFIIFMWIPKKDYYHQKTPDFPSSFISCLQNSILHSLRTILIIYGISISFNMIVFTFLTLIPLKNYLSVLLSGLFDLTRGVFLLSMVSSSFIKRFFLLLFFSFGSLSIHMQTKSILSDTPIRYHSYLLGRIIGFSISFFIYALMIFVCNILN